MTIAEKTFLIRLAVACLCGWITLKLWRIVCIIESERLKNVFNKVFIAFLFFTFARLGASVLDSYFEFGIGIFSNIVNFAFYGGLIYLFYKYRKIFELSEFDTSGKKKVTRIFESVLDEMRIETKRLNEFQIK